jgi:hypothetical protein
MLAKIGTTMHVALHAHDLPHPVEFPQQLLELGQGIDGALADGLLPLIDR